MTNVLTEEEMTTWRELIATMGPDHSGRAHEMLVLAIEEIRRHRATMVRIKELALSLEHAMTPAMRDVGSDLRKRMGEQP